jgi:hypothetical protein
MGRGSRNTQSAATEIDDIRSLVLGEEISGEADTPAWITSSASGFASPGLPGSSEFILRNADRFQPARSTDNPKTQELRVVIAGAMLQDKTSPALKCYRAYVGLRRIGDEWHFAACQENGGYNNPAQQGRYLTKQPTPTLDQAVAEFNKIIAAKLRKGYEVMTSNGPDSGPVEITADDFAGVFHSQL